MLPRPTSDPPLAARRPPVTCKSRLGVAESEEGVDDDREERGKPHDFGYVGVGYHG